MTMTMRSHVCCCADMLNLLDSDIQSLPTWLLSCALDNYDVCSCSAPVMSGSRGSLWGCCRMVVFV